MAILTEPLPASRAPGQAPLQQRPQAVVAELLHIPPDCHRQRQRNQAPEIAPWQAPESNPISRSIQSCLQQSFPDLPQGRQTVCETLLERLPRCSLRRSQAECLEKTAASDTSGIRDNSSQETSSR